MKEGWDEGGRDGGMDGGKDGGWKEGRMGDGRREGGEREDERERGKLCDCRLDPKKVLLNNIYANQIPGQSTCVKSFIFASSYLCALTNTRIIHINNITA